MEAHYGEAEKLERETLDTQRRMLGAEEPETLRSMNNLAATLYREGRYAEAERLQEETIAVQTRILGAEHPDTLRSMSSLGNTLNKEGRLADAAKAQQKQRWTCAAAYLVRSTLTRWWRRPTWPPALDAKASTWRQKNWSVKRLILSAACFDRNTQHSHFNEQSLQYSDL